MGNGETPSGDRQPRRSRGRRRLVRAGLALLVLLVVLALAYGLRARWLGPLVADYLSREARARFGAELAVERITGGWLRDVALEGVSWRSPKPPLLRVDEARVELEYSLLGALKGAPELSLRVSGHGVELELGAGAGAGAEEGETGASLPDLPR